MAHALLPCLLLCECAFADAVLISDGKAVSTIRIPAAATAPEERAADILQGYLLRMSGAEVPIRKDDQPTYGNIISVGRTRHVPARMRQQLKIGEKLIVADVHRDAFVVAAREATDPRGPVLFLLGHRGEGTVYAVYDFLESLGCRWFFACEAGECIPRRPTVSVTPMQVLKKPHFAFRFHYTWGGNARSEETRARERRWLEANRMSGARPKEGGSAHNFSVIWPPKLHKEHPEYFPLNKVEKKVPVATPEVRADLLGQPQDDGDDEPEQEFEKPVKKAEGPVIEWTRVPYGQRCLSNPEVIKLGIEWANRTMEEHPDYDMVPFIQNDGMEGYCQCENCKRLGHYGDQMIYLANQLGKVFLKEHPDKMIHVLSYYESARVPNRKIDGYDTNTDKVWVTLFSNFAKAPFDELVKGWGKASHHLEVADAWQFFSGVNTRRPGWPRAYGKRLQRFTFYREHNVVAVKIIAKSEWAQLGLARYLSAKLMWNATEDLEALTDDFCRRMFPNATDDFRRFIALYDEIERGTIDLEGFMTRGFGILSEMREQLKTKEERRRWEFYALYLHDLILEDRLSKAKTSPDKLALNREIVSFLKGIEGRGVLESSQRIGIIYLPRLKKLKWAKTAKPEALPSVEAFEEEPAALPGEQEGVPAGLAPDEPGATGDKDPELKRGLSWHAERAAILRSVPTMELDADMIDEIFEQDRRRFR